MNDFQNSPAQGNGKRHALEFRHPPRRVVSLVPSLTESMFDLGFGAALVGITDYCVNPPQALQTIPSLGGPKNPRAEEILALKPDLVLANQEENTPQVVEALEAGGARVWVTFPRTVREALDVLWVLVGIFRDNQAAARLETIELAVDWARAAKESIPAWRYFCPIWEDKTSAGQPWWMTFNRQTYIHDVINLVGGENVFAERKRRYPLSADLGGETEQAAGQRDTRYPRVSREEILTANPQVILLPSEPFAYNETKRRAIVEQFSAIQAVQSGRVYLVDGSLITWHGTRLARALQDLPMLVNP